MTFLKYEITIPIDHEFGRVAAHKLFSNHPACVIPVILSRFVELPFLKCSNYNHMGDGNLAS